MENETQNQDQGSAKKGFFARIEGDGSLNSNFDFDGLDFDDLARMLAVLKQAESALVEALDNLDSEE